MAYAKPDEFEAEELGAECQSAMDENDAADRGQDALEEPENDQMDASVSDEGESNDDYRPTAKLEGLARLIEQKIAAADSPPEKAAWKGQLEMVERSIERVRSGDSSAVSEELLIASKLVPADEIEAVGERWDDYEKKYEKIEQEIDEGERSIEVGEVDLLDVRYHQARLETQGEMMAEGLTWDMLGELSDDAGHLVEDNESPELRGPRKAFREIDFCDQRNVLEQAVDDGVLTPEQATWIWNQWR